MTTYLTDTVLAWAADAVGARIDSVEPLHEKGPWRLQLGGTARWRQVVLRTPVPNWINPDWIVTSAAALGLAERRGLPAPRLIAGDLDGRAAGVVATVETVVPGTSDAPPTVSAQRLRAAGAALARVHAIELTPTRRLPLRVRPTQVDDHAFGRRWATLYQASPAGTRQQVVEAFLEATTGHTADSAQDVLTGRPQTPLLHLGDELTRAHGVPAGPTVFVHGDLWAGNMVWESDSQVTLIDWKTAGAGNPGVDLGNLRFHAALQYGPDASALVQDGWERESGRPAADVPYWDAVAALNTPAEMDGPGGFDPHGAPVDLAEITRRRDAFLRTALDRIRA